MTKEGDANGVSQGIYSQERRYICSRVDNCVDYVSYGGFDWADSCDNAAYQKINGTASRSAPPNRHVSEIIPMKMSANKKPLLL